MSFEIIFVFSLLFVALFLFATDYVPFDIAALIILVCLLASGILTPQEGFSGLSNPATVTIGAMFVISEGIRRTGVLKKAGEFFCDRMRTNFKLWLFIMLAFISFASAFMNNTAVIMVFIPIVIDIATRLKVSPSKLLIPLSFAGIMGGISTLIGTSTNLLVNSILEERTGQTFAMFDFTPIGLILLSAGFFYLITIGIELIPGRRTEEKAELTSDFRIQPYLTDLIVDKNSGLIGEILQEADLTRELDLDVLRIFKPESDSSAQRSDIRIESGDVLRIRGSAGDIQKLLQREDLYLKPTSKWFDVDLQKGRDTLLEAAVAPESALEGMPLGKIDFYERFGAVPLAIRHHGELKQEKLEDIKISGGDSLLLSLSRDRIPDLEKDPSFVITSELDTPDLRPGKTFIALGILACVVLAAVLNILPIMVSAPAGVIAMILTGCLTTDEAYTAVNWKVIMLLVGVLPLGTAMDKTGAASLMAEQILGVLSAYGPHVVIAGLYLFTLMITSIISTNASVALLAPIAIEISGQIGVNPEPVVLTVSYAACLTFITPFGHHANTLVYGPGQYKFTDFTRVGLPLNILFWVLAVIFIPIIWPF
ncbi:MAG: SLC13 family permease [Bacteroidetes bacterium]|jgi:di/tricarboxylate transporter|nr:SLC13 family permease [Bacteroidota bacterium]